MEELRVKKTSQLACEDPFVEIFLYQRRDTESLWRPDNKL